MPGADPAARRRGVRLDLLFTGSVLGGPRTQRWAQLVIGGSFDFR